MVAVREILINALTCPSRGSSRAEQLPTDAWIRTRSRLLLSLALLNPAALNDLFAVPTFVGVAVEAVSDARFI